MNHIYRIIFNRSQGIFQAVCELAKASSVQRNNCCNRPRSAHGSTQNTQNNLPKCLACTLLTTLLLGQNAMAVDVDNTVNLITTDDDYVNFNINHTVTTMNGGSIDVMSGDAKITSLSGGSIDTMSGGFVASMSGGGIDRMEDGSITTMSGGGIHVMMQDGSITTMSGGNIDAMINGNIGTLSSGGRINAMSGGNISDMQGGTINTMQGDGSIITTMDGGSIGTMAGGRITTMDGGSIGTMDGGIIAIIDGGSIGTMDGGSIGTMDDGAIDIMAGGRITTMSGGNIDALSYGAITTMDGGRITTMTTGRITTMDGGSIGTMSGGNISDMSGGFIANMSGGSIATIDGGSIGTMSNGAIAIMSSGDIDTMIGGFIVDMSGGSIDTLSYGAITTMSSGDIGTMSNGAITTMSGGNISAMSGGGIFEMSGGSIDTMSGGFIADMSGGSIDDITNSATVTFAGSASTLSGGTVKGNVANTTDLTLSPSSPSSFMNVEPKAGKTFDGILKMQSGTARIDLSGTGTLGSNHLFDMQTGADNKVQAASDVAGLNIMIAPTLSGELEVDAGKTAALANLTADNTTTFVKTGAGTLLLDNDISAGQINHNAGILNIAAGKKATVANGIALASGTTLGVDIASTPAVSANTVNFAGNNTLNITGYSPTTDSGAYTLVQTTAGITGDFNLTVGGVALGTLVDLDTYMIGSAKVENAGKDIVAQMGLVWNNTQPASAHGTFNITGTNSFRVGAALANNITVGAPGFGWDGTALTKTGAGTLLLDGINTYTGLTDVQAGRFIVGSTTANNTATVAGDVDVQSGATLGGHGQINGTVTAKAGATVAPGNSIGTLTVGDIVFNTGSTYEFEGNPDGTGDKIIATSVLGGGTAQIDAGVNLSILGGAGTWGDKTRYVILDADGGVTGAFDNVSSNLAFLTPTLDYANPNQVALTLSRNSTHFANVGITYNQRGTGWGIESLGAGSAIYQQIVSMNAWQANNAFDNLSGEIHGSVKSGMLTNSRYARSAVNQHLNGNGNAASMMTGNTIDAGKALWVNAWGHSGHLKADGNADKLDNKGFGIMVGLDAYSTDKTTLGVALGYEQSELKIGGLRNSKADVDAIHLLAYGRTTAGAIDIKGGLGYSWLSADTTRHIAVGSLLSKNEADYNGGLFQIFAEGSHTFDINDKASVTPYAGLAYQRIKTDSFTEKGWAANLQGNSDSDNITTSAIGVRGNWNLNATSKLYADLGWQHNFGGNTPEAKLNFIGGMPYRIKGVETNRNAAVIGLGANFQIKPNMNISVGYEGLLGNQSRDHGAKVQWELSF